MFKALLAFLLAFVSVEGFAASPCIYQGSYTKCLTDGFIIHNVAYTFPAAQGAADTVLTNNGSGILSWSATSSPTGTANRLAVFDASGDLVSSPLFTLDPAVGGGISASATIVPAASTSYVWSNQNLAINPTADITGVTVTQLSVASNLGTDDSGFSLDAGAGTGGITPFSVDFSSINKSSWGDVVVGNFSAALGNTNGDAVAGHDFMALKTNAIVRPDATVNDVWTLNGGVSVESGAVIRNVNGLFLSNQAPDGIGGNYTGLSFAETFGDVAGNYNGMVWNGNVGDVAGSVQSVNSTVTFGEVTGNTTGFSLSGTIAETNGYQGFADGRTITENATNNVSSFVGGLSLPTTNGFTSFKSNYNVGVSSAIGTSYDASDQIDEITDYNGFSANPTIDLLHDNLKMLNISGTVTGDGAGSARGLYIQTSGWTNFGGGVEAMEVHGDVSMEGRMGFNGSITAADHGGAPASVHTFISGVNVGDGITLANADTIGLNTAGLCTIGAGSTVTSGPFEIGCTALGIPGVVTVGAGSSLDHASSATYAMSLMGSGTIDEMVGSRVISIQGGTVTVGRSYGFLADYMAGDPSTDSWGFYDNGAKHNWLKNTLKIGGTSGSTDVVSAAGISLEIDEKFSMLESGGTPTYHTIFSAGDQSADVNYTLPVDDGTAGQVLTSDGSGVLSWETPGSGTVFSGTYTPSLTNSVNLDSATPSTCQYMRIDNVLNVSCKITVDPTDTFTATSVSISLPEGSTVEHDYSIAGTAACPTIAGEMAAVLGDVDNNVAAMQWQAIDTTSHDMYAHFTYVIESGGGDTGSSSGCDDGCFGPGGPGED
jgi:hypothetical protein